MSPSQQLGPYRLIECIGRGGMGEVWKARDTRLDREVAVKLSAEQFTDRFEREAKAIAALNHPNICTLHDVGPNYLVMELIDGPTLADRIAEGPIPLEESLAIAKQIADALEAAHEKNIVHRDLKPGNIKVRPDGSVKVLDFGLAKSGLSGAEVSHDSPTLAHSPTMIGVILGTAGYMAPEQARGKVVDKRADIWSFGVVLHEMLTGKRTFEGENLTETLAAVIKTDPDLTVIPHKVRRLLRKCLQKDPKNRLRDIGDVWDYLDEPVASVAAPTQSRPRGGWAIAGMALLATAVAILGVLLWRSGRPQDRPVTYLSVDLGPYARNGLDLTAAISPDGRRLAFETVDKDGKRRLATRSLDQTEATLLPGTEDASYPFFSPDSQWIGFRQGDDLKKLSVRGGPPVNICRTVTMRGASWGNDGYIVFTPGTSTGLSRVPANGGTPQLLTRPLSGGAHRWPQAMPGGEFVIFTAMSSNVDADAADISAVSLKTGAVKVLQKGGYYGRYLPSGHLVYIHQGSLFAVPLDVSHMEVRGTPVPVIDGVGSNHTTGSAQFDFSATGIFLYQPGGSDLNKWSVAEMDSAGKIQKLALPPGEYFNPRVSPDGQLLALDTIFEGPDLMIYDLNRNTSRRLTFSHHSSVPVWSPDGKHIAFRDGNRLAWIRSDGSGEVRVLVEARDIQIPWSLRPDGKQLGFFSPVPETGYDVGTVALDLSDPDRPRAGNPEPLLHTAATEMMPRYSPDGRWLAYLSNEFGPGDIFVRPAPGRGEGRWQISSGGGQFPMWSSKGNELYYEGPDSRIRVVPFKVDGDSFVPEQPRVWSDRKIFQSTLCNVDLMADGKHFIVFLEPENMSGAQGSAHVTLVENFLDELKRKAPVK